MRTVFLLSLALLVGACATTHAVDPQVASTSLADAQVVEVKLSNFDFSPSTVRLDAGRAYALHIVNTASGGHDFTAPEFFAASKVAPEDVASVRDGQVELAGGQSATIHLVPSRGTYGLVCTHTGHALLGMKGTIVVS